MRSWQRYHTRPAVCSGVMAIHLQHLVYFTISGCSFIYTFYIKTPSNFVQHISIYFLQYLCFTPCHITIFVIFFCAKLKLSYKFILSCSLHIFHTKKITVWNLISPYTYHISFWNFLYFDLYMLLIKLSVILNAILIYKAS